VPVASSLLRGLRGPSSTPSTSSSCELAGEPGRLHPPIDERHAQWHMQPQHVLLSADSRPMTVCAKRTTASTKSMSVILLASWPTPRSVRAAAMPAPRVATTSTRALMPWAVLPQPSPESNAGEDRLGEGRNYQESSEHRPGTSRGRGHRRTS
jgi:hypothetical protein